jgi:hypothetical protein
MFTDL